MPPFVGVAVNVTFVPGHIVVELAAAVTLTGKFGFTIIVIGVLNTGLLLVQLSDDVSLTRIILPFNMPVVLYVVEVWPATSV